jgi:RNA polymerase sigma factor (sigma-70 family)
MIDSGSIQRCECERRLVGLYKESHTWLVRSAKKITKQQEEAEDLVQELYIYLIEKCNPKIFYGQNTYNLFYAHKFLHSRFMNKVTKLNRVVYTGNDETHINLEDSVYNEDLDIKLQKAHDEVVNELDRLNKTRMWPQSKIFSLYWMSDDTLDEVARKTKISKSTVFLAVKKVRKYLKEVIDNPYDV